MPENRDDKNERGFASMDEEKQREIASKGGHAAHQKGTAHEFSPEEAKKAGHKGGETVAKERGHEFYSEIGKKGGETVAKERGPEFYSEIGKKGGESRGEQREKGEKGRKEEKK